MIRNTDKRQLNNTHIYSNSPTYGSSFIIWNAAQTFLTKQDHIYNSNFQYAGLDIDLSIGAGCLSDLSWITEACVNSRYTGADCNISSLPGRLASINRPIHQAGVLPLTRVSETDEGNKWWREGINQRKGGEAPAPDWPSQAQRWNMMEGLGSGAKRGWELFVWRCLVKCGPGLGHSGLWLC